MRFLTDNYNLSFQKNNENLTGTGFHYLAYNIQTV